MRNNILIAAAMLCVAGGAKADIVIGFPAGSTGEYELESQLISNLTKSRQEASRPEVMEINAAEGKVVVKNMAGDAAYSLYLNDRDAIRFYCSPDENLTLTITSLNPLSYEFKGTELMESVSALKPQTDKILTEYMTLARSENPDQEKMESLAKAYDAVFHDFISANPESPAVAYALLQFDGEDFLKGYESMSAGAKKSILYPLLSIQKTKVEKKIENERRLQALQSGDVDAPSFTLRNLEGKDVSLSDFKGKWVILDFWGSWCPWCIKGFPSLKEAYTKYAGKLEIIGIDCRDKEDVWKSAVAKYELPWVQVYNPESKANALYDAYAVQAFPTKVIVNPEGKIANITIGEDPAFFDKLAEFIGK